MLNVTSMQTHQERIKSELAAAGVSHVGLHRFTSTYLPKVIHEDEHIMGAVFGRRKESEGFFGFVEGILIATDERVLFIDHRPGYTTMDEVNYDNVAGVNINTTLFYASITLFTKAANYHLSFAGREAAKTFANYIERRITHTEQKEEWGGNDRPQYQVAIGSDAMDFLQKHELGVLSTIERTGSISGAVIYYTMIDEKPYFMTKLESRKASNILGNQHIALTVYDEDSVQTVQLQGIVELISDLERIEQVTALITRPRTYKDGSHRAPVLRVGGRTAFYRIVPTGFNYIDFLKK